MKKKVTIGIITAILMGGLLVGCDLTDEQIKVISQNAGLGAGITWIAMDNPDATAKGLVSEALDLVQTNLTAVQAGKTYTEVLYPIINEFARGDSVPDQYEPLVLAGCLSALNGIDILFAANPTWKEQEDLCLSVVNSFIIGVKTGLSLDDDDPIIQELNKINVVNRSFIEK
ncbi:MAG: hypothetical protein WC119_01380 [Synergistaceae bacterium]